MSRKGQRLNIKQPEEKRIIRQHFRPMGERRKKAKIAFNTDYDAWEYIKAHCIHGYKPYRCAFCNLWHIGSVNSKCLYNG